MAIYGIRKYRLDKKKRDWIIKIYDSGGLLYDWESIKNKTERQADFIAEKRMERRSKHEDIGKWELGRKSESLLTSREKLKKMI